MEWYHFCWGGKLFSDPQTRQGLPTMWKAPIKHCRYLIKKYLPFFTFFNFLTCYVLASHPILCQTSCSIPLLQGPCPRFLYISITWRRTPLWASTLGQGFFAFPCSSKTFGTISYSWPQSLNRGSSGKCFKLNSLWAV